MYIYTKLLGPLINKTKNYSLMYLYAINAIIGL